MAVLHAEEVESRLCVPPAQEELTLRGDFQVQVFLPPIGRRYRSGAPNAVPFTCQSRGLSVKGKDEAQYRAEFDVIDAERARAILRAVVGTDPWTAAVHLAFGLGLRREEVLGLTWDDVSDTVKVHRALTYAAGEYHFGPPKSEAGERDTPLPAFVAAALRRHKAAQAERLLPVGIRSELVVDYGIGDPWLPASFSTGWRRFAKARGFEGVTFHGLRHCAATLLLAAGVPDTVALEVMGHADTRILRHYQEVVTSSSETRR